MNIKKWECRACKGYQRKNERINKNFCSSVCFENFKIKKCKYCGEDFKCDILSQRYCRKCSESQEIENKIGKVRYHSNLHDKKCKHCGKEMRVKKQVKLCKKCKNSLPNPLVHKFKDISRDVLCPKCGLKDGEETVKQAWRTQKNKINTRLCQKCREESDWRIDINRVLRNIYLTPDARKYIKEKLKIINSVKRDELKEEIFRLKVELKTAISIEEEKIRQERLIARSLKRKNEYIRETPSEKEKMAQKVSLSMKSNNPMKRADVAERVSKTFHDRIESGQITFKRGAEHWLWRGNRGFNLDCRNRLYKPWILEILKRDRFICTMCGAKKNLHVHHIRTLRKIINIVLQKNEIYAIKDIDTKSNLYEKLIQEVIKEHKLNDGITVCMVCHDKIDERYRRYKGEGKKNLQGKV